MLQGIISVPIYRLFSEREIIHVINNTQVSVVVCDGGILARFVQVMDQCPTLRHIVCMDPIENTICSKCDFWRCRRAFRFLVPSGKNEVSIHCMGNIENRGLVKQYDYVTVESEDCLTIIYTSGSSGFPKGAMMSESAFRANFHTLVSAKQQRKCLPLVPIASMGIGSRSNHRSLSDGRSNWLRHWRSCSSDGRTSDRPAYLFRWHSSDLE